MTDAIMMFLSSTGLFRFLVLDEQIHGQTGSYDDRAWHHVCGTWADREGLVKLFVDGEFKLIGNRSIRGAIPGSGKFILGQDQDSLGGALIGSRVLLGK
ncbi:Pentaxin [Desmophyllum pertusum]|uniref:Pentaxin n=1 Tax=Desmophyllum pertusum TaxID=174260 RepID=A0A9X0CKN2_9CNID|nr:Pentaxin [Desmophyllum pertusum]